VIVASGPAAVAHKGRRRRKKQSQTNVRVRGFPFFSKFRSVRWWEVGKRKECSHGFFVASSCSGKLGIVGSASGSVRSSSLASFSTPSLLLCGNGSTGAVVVVVAGGAFFITNDELSDMKTAIQSILTKQTNRASTRSKLARRQTKKQTNRAVLTEDRRVDGEEAGEGQVGEQREAASGDQPDAELLRLDPSQLLGQPRRPPVAAGGRPCRLRRPRIRRC
jgi:hypothetical protein